LAFAELVCDKFGTMQKNLCFTVVSSIILLGLVGGCSYVKSTSSGSGKVDQGGNGKTINAIGNVPKPEAPLTVPPDKPDVAANALALNYVQGLSAGSKAQGVWMQSGNNLLANVQGTTPLQAASISKVATTLVALNTLGPDHRYITKIGATGPVDDGVVKGDLVIEGGEDPFFVWEEAIAVGNFLNKIGIKRVTGNLIVTGKFYMNFNNDPKQSGTFFKTGVNNKIWSKIAANQYNTLPTGTPKPQVVIDGTVKVLPSAPDTTKPVMRHQSYPLAELAKRMNMYSNNEMAEAIANSVGGAAVVAKKAAELAGVPENEIKLINGSGLTYENRISPRAATAMFRAVENYLKPHNMTIADVFAVIGEDKGILEQRKIPKLAVVKSGSLDTVSALAGALPTEKGTIWFTLMNGDGDLNVFRKQQDVFLTGVASKWGTLNVPPAELTPNRDRANKTSISEIAN